MEKKILKVITLETGNINYTALYYLLKENVVRISINGSVIDATTNADFIKELTGKAPEWTDEAYLTKKISGLLYFDVMAKSWKTLSTEVSFDEMIELLKKDIITFSVLSKKNKRIYITSTTNPHALSELYSNHINEQVFPTDIIANISPTESNSCVRYISLPKINSSDLEIPYFRLTEEHKIEIVVNPLLRRVKLI